jgi:predicted PurR-regulated permease PerM
LLMPIRIWLITKGTGRITSATLLTCGLILVLMVPAIIILVLSVKQGITITQSFTQNDTFDLKVVSDRLWRLSFMYNFFDNQDEFEKQTIEWAQTASKSFTQVALVVMSQIPELLLQLVMATLACFYFLIDGASFIKWFDNKNPLDDEVQRNLATTFRDTSVSTVLATFAAAGAQSLWMFISFLVLGVPAAFLATGLTFIFSWFPLVGCSPIWLVASGFLIIKGLTFKAMMMVVLGLLAGILDNIIRPAVLKGRNDMHPLIGLVAIIGGISLFGVMGVFVRPILVSVLVTLLESWPYISNRYGLMPNQKP